MRSIKSRGGLTRGRELTESVRHQWIFSMHKCAGVHDAMTTMTKLKITISEQHVDLGVSRCKRDYKDLKKIQEWFNYHEPFDMDEKKLRSLSSCLTAMDGDGISPDKTEEVGHAIQLQLKQKIHIEAYCNRGEGRRYDAL